MLDLLGKGTDRGYSMIGVGLSAGLSGSRRARTVQDPLPALDLDWATNRSLPASYGPTPTFTRASTGTYFDGQGILKSAAVNVPRFDHTYNGTSWVSRGLLVEEQRTNLFIQSNTFSSSWTLVRGTVAQDQTGPDGTTSGWTATCNSTGGGHYAYITPGSGASTSGAYTISVFAKKGNNGLISLQMSDTSFANYVTSYFDLTAGTATTPSITGNYSAASAKIENVGSGWYRCSLTATKGSSNGITASVGFSNDSTAGYCTSGQYNYFYNSQLEFGAFPTSAIVTTSAQTTRSADVCQITGSDFSGLWNGTEGSFAVEYDRLAAVDSNFSSGYPRIVTAVKTSDTSRAVTLFASQSPSGEAFFVQDGTVQAWFSAGSLASANVSTKLSTGYKANDFAASLNGSAVATDASGTIPSGIDRMDIGNEYGVTRFHNGHIARLRYYPTRLTNAKLQELST